MGDREFILKQLADEEQRLAGVIAEMERTSHENKYWGRLLELRDQHIRKIDIMRKQLVKCEGAQR